MTYRIVASPIKGQKIIKTVDSVRELHDYLAECHEMDYSIKQVRRLKRPVVQLKKELQTA
jgi:hypothetical protein